MDADGAATRVDIEGWWSGALEGRYAWAEASAWADDRLTDGSNDEMVLEGLLYLVSATSAGVPAAGWSDRMATSLAAWHRLCMIYDADPAGFERAGRRRMLTKFARWQGLAAAQRFGRKLVKQGELSEADVRETLGAVPLDGPVVYEIDGSQVNNLEDFYRLLGEAVNGPDGYFGTNLNALNDCLRGGFGTPESGGFEFVLRHCRHAAAALGYDETVRQLERQLAQCSPRAQDYLTSELNRARQQEGPVVLDWIQEVFQDRMVTFRLDPTDG